MALMDDIISQLQEMGLGVQSYSDIGNITPSQIAGQLQSEYNIGAQDMPSSLFQGISEDVLRSGIAKTYSPQIEATSGNLLSQLQTQLGGKQAKQAYGGFAGSGQQRQFGESARDLYGKGMTEVLGTTGQSRIKGLTNVQDIINQWKDVALSLKGLQ